MRDFRELKVWAKAHRVTLDIYKVTATFPREEIYGITSQMRQSSASIPANMAEGCGRDGAVELARFCRIAMGSASELEYHLLLARDLDYLSEYDYARVNDQLMEVKRMLVSFVQRLKANS